MARKPNVGLGIADMYSEDKIKKESQNMCPPIRVGTMQYGAYTLEEAKKRMQGDPCIPENMKDALRMRGDE